MSVVSLERDDAATEVTEVVVAERGAPAPAPATTAPRAVVGAVLSQGLTIFCVLVVALVGYISVGSGFSYDRAQRSLSSDFATAAQNGTLPPLVTGGAPALGSPVALLRIPAIGVDDVVVEGSTADETMQGPGHLAASPMPGQWGNSVILGHRMGAGGVFADLGSLRRGDRITTVSSSGTKQYRVESVTRPKSKDVSIFGTRNGATTLTLVTSDDAWTASKRLVVTARIVGSPKGFSPGRVAPTAAELGIDRDGNALLPFVLSLQLLLAAIVGGLFLRARWSRSAAWIVTLPVLFATAWLVFEQLTRVLPATL